MSEKIEFEAWGVLENGVLVCDGADDIYVQDNPPQFMADKWQPTKIKVTVERKE